MSFSINVAGDKATILEQLDKSNGSGDLQHFNVAKEAIRAAASGIPDGTTARANAFGHHDYSEGNKTGSFEVHFSVAPAVVEKLSEPQPEPVPPSVGAGKPEPSTKGPDKTSTKDKGVR